MAALHWRTIWESLWNPASLVDHTTSHSSKLLSAMLCGFKMIHILGKLCYPMQRPADDCQRRVGWVIHHTCLQSSPHGSKQIISSISLLVYMNTCLYHVISCYAPRYRACYNALHHTSSYIVMLYVGTWIMVHFTLSYFHKVMYHLIMDPGSLGIRTCRSYAFYSWTKADNPNPRVWVI